MSLVAGISGIVALPETNDDIVVVLEDVQPRMDDAWWYQEIRRWPFSWRRFDRWWLYRRWIIPRDIRKEEAGPWFS